MALRQRSGDVKHRPGDFSLLAHRGNPRSDNIRNDINVIDEHTSI